MWQVPTHTTQLGGLGMYLRGPLFAQKVIPQRHPTEYRLSLQTSLHSCLPFAAYPIAQGPFHIG
jgi:hypothetical protein